MIRVRSFLKYSLLILVLTLSASVLTNLTIVPNIETYVLRSKAYLNELNTLQQKTSNGFEVIRFVIADGTQADLLTYSFASIQTQQASRLIILGQLKELVQELNQLSLFRHQSVITESLLLIDDLIAYQSYVERLVEDQENYQAKFDALSTILPLEQLSLEKLITLQTSLIETMLSDLSLIINGLILFLVVQMVLVISILSVTLTRAPLLIQRLKSLVYANTPTSNSSPKKTWLIEVNEVFGYLDELDHDRRFLRELREALAHRYVVDDVMEALHRFLNLRFHVYRLGVAFIDYDKKRIIAEYGVIESGEIKLGPGFSQSFKQTSIVDLIEAKGLRYDPDIHASFKKRPTSASLKLIVDEGIKSNVILPLKVGDFVFGFLFVSSNQSHYFTPQHLEWLEEVVDEISGILDRSYFTKIIFSKIVFNFARLVDHRDRDTGEHLNRMVVYSGLIARGLLKNPKPGYEINARFLLELERSAATHDLGKVATPDAILKKEGPLTEEEWSIMREHPIQGAKIFTDFREALRNFDQSLFEMAEDIALYHHEKVDGSGYPHGLKGSEIPLAARIVAVADVFDALSTQRIYKQALSINQSFEKLNDLKGHHLDDVLVDVFLSCEDEIRAYLQTENAHG